MRHALAWVALTLLAPSLMAQGFGRGCVPHRENRTVGAQISLQPGTYRLTLVATVGLAAGYRATGMLRLWSTHRRDTSAATGLVSDLTDTRTTPLYGATDLNFQSVGAPVDSHGDSVTPAPDSRDPVAPGVLVRVTPADSSTVADMELLIGTLSNRRIDEGWEDGRGIALHVRTDSAGRYAGSWRQFGIIYDGSGYFCLEPATQ